MGRTSLWYKILRGKGHGMFLMSISPGLPGELVTEHFPDTGLSILIDIDIAEFRLKLVEGELSGRPNQPRSTNTLSRTIQLLKGKALTALSNNNLC
jgi:hypothetical protein